MASETYRERAIRNAKGGEKFEAMLAAFGNAVDHKELKWLMCTLYVPDLSYDRGDICLAMKVVEMERKWGQYGTINRLQKGETDG